MTIDREDFDPSLESTGDKVHRVVRAALGAVPYGAAGAVELFNSLILPPLEKRRIKWMHDVTDALEALQKEQKIGLNEIFESELFVSTVIEASTIAIRTHEELKLEALRNAVINSALNENIESSRREMFIRYVSELTVWHLKILILFNDPLKWAQVNAKEFTNYSMGSRSSILEEAYSELKGDRDFYDQLWNDLHARGLVSSNTLHGSGTGEHLITPCTTRSGKEFVKFISIPE